MKKILLILAMGMTVGCNIPPDHLEDGEDISGALSYFKDRYGICYAATKSNNGHFMSIYSIATVPCEKVGL